MVAGSLATGCDSASSAAHEQTVPPVPQSEEPSANRLFEQSCAAFSQSDALDALLNGFEDQDAIAMRITEALDLAEAAAAADPGTYGSYGASFRRYAETMGRFIAELNDRFSTATSTLEAARKIKIPGGPDMPSCPDSAPDSAGLPLPSES